jgi:hypothetical protein
VNRGLATVAVALLLPLVAGCSLLPGAKASPAASTLSEIPAGTHTTTAFQPATTYTVAAGWLRGADAAGYFNLLSASDQNNGIHVFHNPQALAQDATCPIAAQAAVGVSANELVAWIRSLKGLNVSLPTMVTVSGLPAARIDVSIHTDWTQSCSFANGLRTVPLFYWMNNSGWWLAGDEKARLYLVDVPGEGTVVVDLDSFTGDGFGDLLTSGQPVVQSFQFAAK